MGTVTLSSELAILVFVTILGLLQLWTIRLTRQNGNGLQDKAVKALEDTLGRWTETVRKRSERLEKATPQGPEWSPEEVNQVLTDPGFNQAYQKLVAGWKPKQTT